MVSGTRTTATAIAVQDSLRGPSHVTFQFTTSDGSVLRATTVARQFGPGARATIYYNPDRPDWIRVDGDWAGAIWVMFCLAAAVFFTWATFTRPDDQ